MHRDRESPDEWVVPKGPQEGAGRAAHANTTGDPEHCTEDAADELANAAVPEEGLEAGDDPWTKARVLYPNIENHFDPSDADPFEGLGLIPEKDDGEEAGMPLLSGGGQARGRARGVA